MSAPQAAQIEPFEPERAPTGQELAERGVELNDLDVRHLHTGEPAYRRYSAEMIKLAGSTIMPKNYKLAELYYLIEVAATYGLDPFAKEVWAIRMRDNESEPVTILVGVDGLQAIAERHRDYLGARNMEVYEGDTFRFSSEPRQLADGTWTHVTHEFDVTASDRGKLLGAYAEVLRASKPPIFFWAKWEEYARTSAGPWQKQKTAMIRKCALANALRRAYRISGLYIPEELDTAGARAHMGAIEQSDRAPEDLMYGDDAWQAQRLKDLFSMLDEVKPNEWLPGRKRLLLTNLDADGRQELISQLEREIVDAGGTPPLPPDPADLSDVVVPDADQPIAFADGEHIEDGEFTVPGEDEEEVCVHPADRVVVSESGRFCDRCKTYLPEDEGSQETLGL